MISVMKKNTDFGDIFKKKTFDKIKASLNVIFLASEVCSTIRQ